MRLSIVTPILNSHEVVRRQLFYYRKMDLPDDVEIIFVDDGSEPQLDAPDEIRPKNFKLIRTYNKEPWTEHIARNRGVKIARGEYIFLVDIDYILTFDAVKTALTFNGDRMGIRRQFGILDRYSDLKDDNETLARYNLKKRWIRKKVVPGHRSQFAMRKDLFWQMGGYNEKLDGVWRRTGGAGERFWRKWQRFEKKGLARQHDYYPMIYIFPNGKFCDRGNKLFRQ